MKEKFIVAIGSSAGGLAPLSAFFDCTPHDHVTYIILCHLPFAVHRKIQQILQCHSKLKIVEAEDNQLIQPDTIYTPPPWMYMTIEDDRLFLKSRAKFPKFPNRVTDIFMSSLAKEKRSESIGIILSGRGSDGSKGACSIREAGGMVIAQDPGSCEQRSMPLHAIEAECVDHILIPEDMPPVILGHVNKNFPTL
jgi:two-component system CheB/CheR fusion protein